MNVKTSSLLTALILVVYPLFGLGTGAKANTLTLPEQSSVELAQANTQNCRVPNRIQDIYSDPSVEGFSRTLLTVQANTPFYVDRNTDGSLVLQNGFARGRTNNTTGWIITRYLTTVANCGGTTPPPPEDFCASALTNLTVRRNPAIVSNNIIGALNSGAVVRIEDESYDATTGRTWIQFPYTGSLGWAAETGGFNGGGRNFSARYRCDR
jgi:hypothetical protein